MVGETVKIVIPGGYDSNGIPLPPVLVEEIPGCVITPKGTGAGVGRDYFFASEDMSILAPKFIEDIPSNAEFLVRGETYALDGIPFDHRSVFGSQYGGTEIPVKRVKAT